MSHFPDIDTQPASGLRGAPCGPRHGRWKRGHKSPADFAARHSFDRLADEWRLAAFGNERATVLPHLPRSTPNGVDPFPPANPRWRKAILSGFGPAQVRRHVIAPEKLAALEAATVALLVGIEGMTRRLKQAGDAVSADDLDSMAMVLNDLAALLIQTAWCERIVETARQHVAALALASAARASFATASTSRSTRPS